MFYNRVKVISVNLIIKSQFGLGSLVFIPGKKLTSRHGKIFMNESVSLDLYKFPELCSSYERYSHWIVWAEVILFFWYQICMDFKQSWYKPNTNNVHCPISSRRCRSWEKFHLGFHPRSKPLLKIFPIFLNVDAFEAAPVFFQILQQIS